VKSISKQQSDSILQSNPSYLKMHVGVKYFSQKANLRRL